MNTTEISIEVKQVDSIRELQVLEGGEYLRKLGQLYFQVMPNGRFMARVISPQTNGDWITKMINQKTIYIPTENVQTQDR